ncbi:hypothetical protein [Cohnella lupini]|uniref:Uncharacterized protein n=1 Tax=Cohnella lupini TaxID=1294267 RepID=A0A3D9IFD1_9BACL|nr:hypothetical protein [Cohnella lupini]RED60259.1 hypothetical protein DFP95_10648 [Cohnella lupini]
MFEDEYAALYEKQLREARGQRREMLERDLSGTKKMLEIIHPIIGTLEGIILEHEMVGLSGVKIYGDAFISSLRTVIEEENYITHAESITRKRFTFERARMRSVGALGFTYYPYGRDELEQQPDVCRRDLQDLISLKMTSKASDFAALPVLEREVLRFAAAANPHSFNLTELSEWLHIKNEASGRFAKSLEKKELLTKVGGGERRCHEFTISENGLAVLLGKSNHHAWKI